MQEKWELQIVYLPINELKPYQKNARKHGKKDIDNIAKSIQKYGMCDAIGIWSEENIIVEGHGRWLACKQLGMKEVPCVRLDHLTDQERREYAIAHNATAELSQWDFDILPQELADIDLGDFDFEFLGDEQDSKEEVHGEVEFSEILGEENNYIVLQFKTDIDWLNAQSIFGLKTVKCYSTRKDGKVTKSMERKGVARVLDGAKAIQMILGDKT